MSGHFQIFFIIFFSLPDPKSEKNSCKSTNKKFWPYIHLHSNVFLSVRVCRANDYTIQIQGQGHTKKNMGFCREGFSCPSKCCFVLYLHEENSDDNEA